MFKIKQFARVLRAVIRREPLGHIQDLWGLFVGRLREYGEPPNTFLLCVCTRRYPHKCYIDGPCNGVPR